MNEIDWKKRPFYAIRMKNRGLELTADVNLNVVDSIPVAKLERPSPPSAKSQRLEGQLAAGLGTGRAVVYSP
jgi:hypothetical protein